MNLTIPARERTKPAVGPKPAPHKSLFRRIFDDKPEHSFRLRVIGLLATVWAAFSLIYVGVDPLIPLAAIGALFIGHSLSWTRRKKRTPVVSLAIGIFIIFIGVYMRNDLVLAIQGPPCNPSGQDSSSSSAFASLRSAGSNLPVNQS